jgi:hypothetical protein
MTDDQPGPIEAATADHVCDFWRVPDTCEEALDAIAMAKIIDDPQAAPSLRGDAMARLLATVEGLHCICVDGPPQHLHAAFAACRKCAPARRPRTETRLRIVAAVPSPGRCTAPKCNA